MSELNILRKRIDNIVRSTGKAPNVLDINPDKWEPLLEEAKALSFYNRQGFAGFGNPKSVKLFGVLIVKGRYD